tara:strand:- start:833 stop:1828 length:996 start_codon:yes stop_codon:yes gene_type:complete
MGLKISGIVKRRGISFGELKNKKIAVDFSNAAYQFLSSIRQRDGTPLTDSKGNVTSHLQGILSRSSNLLSQGIKICYILDGPPPQLKHSTQRSRQQAKVVAEEKFEEAKQSGNEEMMLKYSRQFSRLTMEMSKESAELISAMGIPVIKSPAEADAQIAHCCKSKDVWAGATSDFDLLVHGCPKMLTSLTLSQTKRSPELIELNKVLSDLQINQEQLISLAILAGTDYSPGIIGVGPKKALKIVRELKIPKKIFSEYPLEDVHWKEAFDLFKNMKVQKRYKLQWSLPDIEKVLKILVDKHDFSEVRVMSSLENITGKKGGMKRGQKGLSSWM